MTPREEGPAVASVVIQVWTDLDARVGEREVLGFTAQGSDSRSYKYDVAISLQCCSLLGTCITPLLLTQT